MDDDSFVDELVNIEDAVNHTSTTTSEILSNPELLSGPSLDSLDHLSVNLDNVMEGHGHPLEIDVTLQSAFGGDHDEVPQYLRLQSLLHTADHQPLQVEKEKDKRNFFPEEEEEEEEEEMEEEEMEEEEPAKKDLKLKGKTKPLESRAATRRGKLEAFREFKKGGGRKTSAVKGRQENEDEEDEDYVETKHEEDHERDYEETGLEDDTTTKKVCG